MLVSGGIRKCCENASHSTEAVGRSYGCPGANHENFCGTEPCGDGADLAALFEQESIVRGMALG